jgi:hypothetical protein
MTQYAYHILNFNSLSEKCEKLLLALSCLPVHKIKNQRFRTYYLSHLQGKTVSPETLVFNLNQTPGNYPKEDNFNTL